jgi:hypothetical protein
VVSGDARARRCGRPGRHGRGPSVRTLGGVTFPVCGTASVIGPGSGTTQRVALQATRRLRVGGGDQRQQGDERHTVRMSGVLR